MDPASNRVRDEQHLAVADLRRGDRGGRHPPEHPGPLEPAVGGIGRLAHADLQGRRDQQRGRDVVQIADAAEGLTRPARSRSSEPRPTPSASRYSSGVPTASRQAGHEIAAPAAHQVLPHQYRPPVGGRRSATRAGPSLPAPQRSSRTAISRPGSVRSVAGTRPPGSTGGPGWSSAAGPSACTPVRVVAVVGVQQQPVRQHLDPLDQPGHRCLGAASWVPGGKRNSSTSREQCAAISSAGEPWATIRPPSITTSRSHNCSASSM